jgi:type II secretory pathway component GspD/PulD (secretin)
MFEQSNQAEDRTPGLYKVPIIGRLFKRNNTDTTTRELVLLITPKIVKG